VKKIQVNALGSFRYMKHHLSAKTGTHSPIIANESLIHYRTPQDDKSLFNQPHSD
jgi:hypothetical protein